MIGTLRKRRKLCGILFLLMVLVSISANAQEIRKPKAHMKEHFFDFKEVLEGEVISHTFSIYNKGNEELKILKVRAG